jgi:radical SAM protein with 4Fe4S-binding SPASM domain
MFIQEAHARGLHTNISSNGTDSRILEEIAGTRGGATVGISVNDWQTFEQVQQFIRNYAPIVKMVYTEPIDQRLIDAVLSLNPQQFYLIYRDAIQEDDLQYSLPFYRFKAGVAALPQAARIGTVSCSGFLPDFDTYPELSLVRCPAGTTKLGVMPDGSVYPCNLLFGRNEFMLGNILTDPFDAIWRHPVLAFFRTYQGNTCPKFGCELHSRCHGGCPAHSFLLSGDLAGPDPRCFMP